LILTNLFTRLLRLCRLLGLVVAVANIYDAGGPANTIALEHYCIILVSPNIAAIPCILIEPVTIAVYYCMLITPSNEQ